MILISSAAYVISEFQAELGRIPPCFLPLGNKKVLENQVAILKEKFPGEIILVSLPESYCLSKVERVLIDNLGIIYISIPDDFSLSESVSYALNVTNYLEEDNIIRIMYGDTLIHDFPSKDNIQDLLGVAHSYDSYSWKIEQPSDEPLIWCGFYSFTIRPLLLRCLALSRHDFVNAIELYRKEQKMQLHEFTQWFDLGHVNTYFRSRASITTQRAFNELRIENGIVHKTGSPSIKIQAEGFWFKNIPTHLKIFTPQLIEEYLDTENKAHYKLEYLPNIPLNELFVHGKNSATEWKGLFRLIRIFLDKAHLSLATFEEENIKNDFLDLVKRKTYSRLKLFLKSYNFDPHKSIIYQHDKLPSLCEICHICIKNTINLPSFYGILHGDLCFSNILYDSRSLQIKVIDPRGLNTNGEFTIYGDQKYDLAKLTHSVIGLYDHIISGRYVLKESFERASFDLHFDIDDRIREIQESFLKFEFIPGISTAKIMPLVVLLFISMLPLHNDRPDRQKAMLANAIRLYRDYVHMSVKDIDGPNYSMDSINISSF